EGSFEREPDEGAFPQRARPGDDDVDDASTSSDSQPNLYVHAALLRAALLPSPGPRSDQRRLVLPRLGGGKARHATSRRGRLEQPRSRRGYRPTWRLPGFPP